MFHDEDPTPDVSLEEAVEADLEADEAAEELEELDALEESPTVFDEV